MQENDVLLKEMSERKEMQLLNSHGDRMMFKNKNIFKIM